MNQYYDIAKYQNNLLFAKRKNTFIKLTPDLVISLYYNRVPKSHKQLMQIEIREGKIPIYCQILPHGKDKYKRNRNEKQN